MGCLGVRVKAVPSFISADCKEKGGMIVGIRPVYGDLTPRVSCLTSKPRMQVSIVCGTNIGEGGFLYASDALLLTILGERLIVQEK